MKSVILSLILVLWLALPAGALELTAPEVPESGQDAMPQDTENFGNGLMELLRNAVGLLAPELEAAAHDCCRLLAAALVCSVLPLLTRRTEGMAALAGTVLMAALLLEPAGTMLSCAAETLEEVCAYGKLLCPVMTTALAAQGGVTASAALYTGTIGFISVLSMLVKQVMLPIVAIFFAFSVGYSALGEALLRRLADGAQHFLGWLLKTMLMVFTTYMSITGVVSGTTDAAARKAAKVAFSSAVPVVGGILSDASESVLVSVGVLKNAAGVYGILAVLAVLAEPFLRLGVQYLMLKATALLCTVLAEKRLSGLVEDFSAALGLLLAMVASGSVMVLISTVCFMKGMGL